MAKSNNLIHRRLCIIARDVLLVNPRLSEMDLAELIKTAAARAHLPYNTETVWKAMNAVQHSMRKRHQTGPRPFQPTSHEVF